MIIHHINYIHNLKQQSVPKEIWQQCVVCIATNFIAKDILDLIPKSNESYSYISVDRHKARIIITEGKGSRTDSIISQVTPFLISNSKRSLRRTDRIWSVSFVGERAIDAGGPARELIGETADSIFQPTTGLFIQVPNGRCNKGGYKNTYIPSNISLAHTRKEFKAIGIFVGILVRMGLSTEMPFAPLVYKFLAEQQIGLRDILLIDSNLEEHYKLLMGLLIQSAQGKEEEAITEFNKMELNWTVEDWNGNLTVLPLHQKEEKLKFSEIEQYFKEVTNFRINLIEKYLIEMRGGFQENTELVHVSLLTGPLLSTMVQGSNTVSLAHIKAITVVMDYSGGMENENIQRFFRACERLTPEQMKLLLKFITTLSRIPNSLVEKSFQIKIDKVNATDVLPTASTCFNKLHLPLYSNDEICYQRIVTAITECQTMETA